MQEELTEANQSPYRKAALALRNKSLDPKRPEADRHAYGMHASLLNSSNPADHQKSATLAKHHETAIRDEISDAVHSNSSKINSAKYHQAAGWKRLKEENQMNPMDLYVAAIASNKDLRDAIVEKKLTPAEMKKREEVAKAIDRENPGMSMGKKMAIATATAKKVAEETDDGEWKPTGKRAKHMETGEDTFEYAKVDKEGNRTGERHYRNAKGEVMGEARISSNTLRRAGQKAIAAMKQAAKEREGVALDTEREKDLAAAAAPYDKITHKDVLVKRGVIKAEGVDLDEEQLDELSKDTLKSYIKNASTSVHNAAFKSGESHAKGDYPGMGKEYVKSYKRQLNIGKAVDRLTKEDAELDEEQLDELKKSTLQSYASKASKAHQIAAKVVGTADSAEKATAAFKTAKKRQAGGLRAADKLAYGEYSEEADLDEAYGRNRSAAYNADGSANDERHDLDGYRPSSGYKSRYSRAAGAAGARSLADMAAEIRKKKEAQAKLPEEYELDEEQLDEISKKTALSYLMKSGKDIEKGTSTGEKRNKRIDGYFAAGKRLSGEKPTSEEYELDESFVVKDHQGKRTHVAFSEGEAKRKAEELTKKTGNKHTVVFTRSAMVAKEEYELEEELDEVFKGDTGHKATVHYRTTWSNEPQKRVYNIDKDASDDSIKRQHYKLFGGTIDKIERHSSAQ